jgi:hypothetical protein
MTTGRTASPFEPAGRRNKERTLERLPRQVAGIAQRMAADEFGNAA